MSKSKSSSASRGGTGIAFTLFIVFMVLKLTGHIDWSWWWVTAPLWGSVALVVGVFLLAIPILFLVELGKELEKKSHQ